VSIVEICHQLSSTKVDAQTKLDGRRSTKLTIPPSYDARPLVCRSERRTVSTARFRRTGLLATADTCDIDCQVHSYEFKLSVGSKSLENEMTIEGSNSRFSL